MKRSWTRLLQIISKTGAHVRFREQRFNHLFLRHHRWACEIVYTKDRRPLAAVYFAPEGLNRQETKAFFRAVQERTLYAYELEDEPK